MYARSAVHRRTNSSSIYRANETSPGSGLRDPGGRRRDGFRNWRRRTEAGLIPGKGAMMAKWKCTVCGYVYDPEKGDPESGIDPGTPFEKLPDDWVCPDCGVGKNEFEKM